MESVICVMDVMGVFLEGVMDGVGELELCRFVLRESVESSMAVLRNV
jgi:hypothetical protein